MMIRSRRQRRRGYVLVVTLGLLVLAAALMVQVGRASLRHAIAAREAADELQQRWGAASCRAAVLPVAENILASAEAKLHKPVPVFRTSVKLGEQTFEMILCDEQAKANVNAMIADADARQASQRLISLLSGTGLINQLRLRPAAAAPTTRPTPSTASTTRPGATSAPAPPGVITGFGQIFDNVPPARLIAPAVSGQPAPIELVTCWGNGLINVRRAGESTIRLIASPPLTGPEVTRLIDARNAALRGESGAGAMAQTKQPTTKVSTAVKLPAGGTRATPRLPLLGIAGVSDRNGVKLTETSRCHSLWVITRTKQRDYHCFSVRDDSEGTGGIAQSAVW